MDGEEAVRLQLLEIHFDGFTSQQMKWNRIRGERIEHHEVELHIGFRLQTETGVTQRDLERGRTAATEKPKPLRVPGHHTHCWIDFVEHPVLCGASVPRQGAYAQ